MSFHGQSPLSVGPCSARTFSQTATPSLRAHYRDSTLLWMAPTSAPHRPCPCLFRLFTGARLQRTETRTSSVTAYSRCQARHGLGPGEHRHRTPWRDTGCCLPEGQSRPRSPTKIFAAQHLQGRLHPLPLHLARFRTYASTRPLPVAPQGSILGSKLAMIQVEFVPTRLRDIASRTDPFHCRLRRVPWSGGLANILCRAGREYDPANDIYEKRKPKEEGYKECCKAQSCSTHVPLVCKASTHPS